MDNLAVFELCLNGGIARGMQLETYIVVARPGREEVYLVVHLLHQHLLHTYHA